jgi:hypothetical protein
VNVGPSVWVSPGLPPPGEAIVGAAIEDALVGAALVVLALTAAWI